MPDSIVDAVVIGSGVSGLTSALALARKGWTCRVLDAAPTAGGLLGHHHTSGYEFDIGVQYVGQAGTGEAFPRHLEALGLNVEFREFAPDCLERYVFADFETKLVKNANAQFELLLQDFPREEAGLKQFFDAVHALDVLQAGVEQRRMPWQVRRAMRGMGHLRGITRLDFRSWVSRFVRDPHLISALSCFVGDIALPPSRAGALACLLDWVHFMGGAYYPVGGGEALRDAFMLALDQHGVEITTNAEVQQIVREGKEFELTLLHGFPVRTRVVISSADACTTFSWLDRTRCAPTYQRKATSFGPSLSACGMFLGVDVDLRQLGLTEANLWLYEANQIDDVYTELLEGRTSERLAVFVASPSLKDPGRARAPEGMQGLLALAFTPAFHQHVGPSPPNHDTDVLAKRGDRVLEFMESRLPGLREHVRFREDAGPNFFWSRARARQGGLYGPAMSAEQGFPRRFSPRTGIPGVYLAGSSIFGCGILPCLLSGRLSAQCGHLHLRWRHGRPKRKGGAVLPKAVPRKLG